MHIKDLIFCLLNITFKTKTQENLPNITPKFLAPKMTHKLSILVLLCVAFISLHESWGANEMRSLFYLGSVDGKLFFADSTTRTSPTSEAFCVSNNMRIAEITSLRQQLLLQSKFNTSTFTGGHWIGAQLNNNASKQSYYWRESSFAVEEFGQEWTFQTGLTLCLQYNAAAENTTIPNGAYMSMNCATNAKVLCETDL